MRSLFAFILIFFVTSCAPIYVNYDYEKSIDFNQYNTYNYYSNIDTGLSELDTKRFMNILDEQLNARGFQLSETPDFYINIRSETFQELQRNSVGVSIGSTGRNFGGGVSMGIPIGQNNMNREITIDFVDESRMGLFWQAIAETSYNPNYPPEKKEERFRILVQKILHGYPPKL
ncbi:MAG: DUF4136 domain-containing protein [Flavobacteriaceae bacterium]|nr:DUF4136 domain-containing protein [Flavobacteriaceae bacterium]